MTPDEYEQVKDVFAEAVQVAAAERNEFVRERCGGQSQIIDEVLSLLKHHQDDTILEEQVRLPTTETHGATIPLRRQSIASDQPTQTDPYLVLTEVWDENRQILRRRLIIVASVLSALIAFSLVRLFTYHSAAVGYGVRIAAMVAVSGCAWILRRRSDLTLTQIRIAEAWVIANVGILVIVIDVRLMFAYAAAADEATLISVNNWNYFTWTLIIFIYGVFMPNTWRRAACVMLPLAAIPSIVTLLAGWFDTRIPDLLDDDQFGQPIPTPFVAALVAIYAAHLIHGARLSAFRAKHLAQYHLGRLIGEGGMGQVFEAEHVLLKRACAIKLIRPEYCADDRALQRFQREVRATATLTHPNTIEVYDYGQTKDGVFFFAMELLPGMNLRDLVKTAGPLPPARAVHFLTDVCEALTEAHAAGLIHRDIKPANVFASERGGIRDFTKLLDFGVVREMKIDGNQSIAGNVVAGSPSFISPEHMTSPGQIDARADIYAAGAVLYYLLTARPPFVGDSAIELMFAQVNHVPAPPTTYQPEIPADLESVVMRCLAKDAGDRPDNAEQLLKELKQCDCAGLWTRDDAKAWWAELAGVRNETRARD